MFVVDKTPYKYITKTLAADEAYSIPSISVGVGDKVNGLCTQILVAVSGDANAQVKWRSDPAIGESASDGTPLLQYGTLELKNGQAIVNLRFYCVSAATLHITLMR